MRVGAIWEVKHARSSSWRRSFVAVALFANPAHLSAISSTARWFIVALALQTDSWRLSQSLAAGQYAFLLLFFVFVIFLFCLFSNYGVIFILPHAQ